MLFGLWVIAGDPTLITGNDPRHEGCVSLTQKLMFAFSTSLKSMAKSRNHESGENRTSTELSKHGSRAGSTSVLPEGETFKGIGAKLKLFKNLR